MLLLLLAEEAETMHFVMIAAIRHRHIEEDEQLSRYTRRHVI